MFVRSPIFIKLLSGLIVKGSNPLNFVNLSIVGIFRGLIFCTQFAISFIWSGVVPQHPPTIFSNPLCANSEIIFAIDSGDSSYSPNSLGRPALGYTKTLISAIIESSSSQGRICSAPNAQFNPTANKFACRMECQNASTVCPDRVLPLASVMVPETKIGI